MSNLAVALGIVVSLASAVAVAQSLEFRRTVLAVGDVHAIVTGHFNRDPWIDAAVTNPDSNTVSVLLGRGKGRFASPRSYAVGAVPLVLRTADFNGDGALDLAVVNGDGVEVSVLLGNGRGGFRLRIDTPVCDSCTSPRALAPGDFNGDGRVDLAVAFVGSNAIATFVGRGDGTFDRIDRAWVVRDDPQWLEAGDFNRDGHLDLASANLDLAAAVSTIHGNGDGTFRTGPEYGVGAISRSLAIDDFNHDGLLDIVATTFSVSPGRSRDAVLVLLGDGSGNFFAAPELQAGTQPMFVSVADFNGDNRRDLAVANVASDTVTIFLGNGDGTFTRATDLVSGDGPIQVATGDFNRDGLSDLAVSNQTDQTVSVFLSVRRR